MKITPHGSVARLLAEINLPSSKICALKQEFRGIRPTTGATQLFQAEVPEKIIQQRTGYRSLASLRDSERTTEEQHQAVSSLLAAGAQLPTT